MSIQQQPWNSDNVQAKNITEPGQKNSMQP